MKDFAWQMNQWVNNTIKTTKEEAEKIAEDIVEGVIALSPHPSGAEGRPSPYSTGEFVNNWNVGANTSSDYTEVPITTKQAKIEELKKAINGWFDTHNHLYIWNSGPYVAQVEFEGWKYADEYAPIRRTLDRIRSRK